MKAVRTPGLSKFPDVYEQGQFDIVTEPSGQKRFWFVCPGPCKSISAIAIRPVQDESSQSWGWDGNEESPTLDPSIHHIGCWHGWLKNGEFA